MPAPSSSTPFCAVCVEPIAGKVHREPLGRNNALVNVCSGCRTETPRAYTREGGYEVPDASVSQAKLVKRLSEGLERMAPAGEAMLRRPHLLCRPLTPGYLIVRVRRRAPGGHSRDQWEAFQEIANEPWAKEARFLGVDRRFVLFERPDPNIAADKRAPSENPLAWLEQFRSDG